MAMDTLPEEQPPEGSGYLGLWPSFEPPALPSPVRPPLGSRPPGSFQTRHRSRSRTAALAVTALVLIVVYLPVAWRVVILGPLDSASAAAGAQDAVRGFLGALVAGDATAALSYAAAPPADPRLLTDEVLAGSLATAPMGGVQVLGSTGSLTHQIVHSLYRMGDRELGATFDVLRLDEQWLLQSVSTMADLSRISARALGLKLNGVVVPSDSPDLFIGTYTVTTSDHRFAITNSTFWVESLRTHPDTTGISVRLSDKGVNAVRDAARTKLAACLTTRKLAPAGCGFRAPTPGREPRGHTITWQATGGATDLETLRVTLIIDDPARARGNVKILVGTTYLTTDGLVRRATSAISGVYVTFVNFRTEVTFVARE
jgi:hypothetical protein